MNSVQTTQLDLNSMITKYYGSNSTVCSDCRHRHLYKDLTCIDGRLLCPSCIEICDVCDGEVPLVLATFHSNDPYQRVHCPKCEAARPVEMRSCDGCGVVVDVRDLNWVVEGFEYCEACFTEGPEFERYRPEVEFPAGEFMYR